MLRSGVFLSGVHREAFKKLSTPQQAIVIEKIALELARAKQGFSVGSEPPFGNLSDPVSPWIQVQRGVPITDDMTEAAFGNYLADIDDGVTSVRSTIFIELENEVERMQHANAK